MKKVILLLAMLSVITSPIVYGADNDDIAKAKQNLQRRVNEQVASVKEYSKAWQDNGAIPKAYGRLIQVSGSSVSGVERLYFEADDGTIRIVMMQADELMNTYAVHPQVIEIKRSK